MGIPIPKITGLGAITSNLGLKSARNVESRNRMAGDALASLVGDIKSKEIQNEHQAAAIEYAGAQAGKAARTKGFTSMLGSIASPFVKWGTNSFMNNVGGGWAGGSPGFTGRGSAGTDAWGLDFDDPNAMVNPSGYNIDPFGTDSTYGGRTIEWTTDMDIPGSSSTNIFGYNSPHTW